MALGDLAFEETGKFAGIRALPDGKVEETYQGTGKLFDVDYRLFSKGKTPVQVGIALNLRQLAVTTLYREYCKLTQLENLSRIYEEIKREVTVVR